jgi:hypothetical protein
MGVMLVRKVLPNAAFLLSIGGSEATRAIMPKIGFATIGQLPVYARPIRPFYQLRCPIGHLSCWILEHNNQPAGWFLLSRLRGQCRLLDLRLINSTDPADYAAAYAIAVQTAHLDPATHELTVQGSLAPQPSQALLANGFVLRENRPLFLCDPQGHLRSISHHLLLSRLDDDSAAFDFPEYPYLT